MRVLAWPRLLGINLIETMAILPGDEEISQHGEFNQGENDQSVSQSVQ